MAEATLDTNPDDTSLIDAGGDNGDQGDQGSAPNPAAAQPGDQTSGETTGAEVKGDGKPAAAGDKTADGKPAEGKPASKGEVLADWPADWRDKVSAGDAKKLARLSRYASPQAVADALIEAQNRISKGGLNPVLSKESTTEEIAAYRSANGIPEAPEKYDVSEYKISDTEKESIAGFLKRAHETNQTPAQVKAALDTYYEIAQKGRESRYEQDNQIKADTEDALRKEWGEEFRSNISRVNTLLSTAPEGFAEKFLKGRLADGTPIGSDPTTLRFLLGLELERNPGSTVVPGAGGGMAQSIEDELKKIADFRSKDRKAYNKDEAMQSRERELINAQIKMKDRQKAA